MFKANEKGGPSKERTLFIVRSFFVLTDTVTKLSIMAKFIISVEQH